MTWRELGDVCEFKYGSSLPASARRGEAFRVYGSNGVVGTHQQPLTDGPTIVIGRKGSIGEVNFSDRPCWPIDTTYFIDRSATKADLRWLSYALSGLRLGELNKATGVPGLNRNDAYQKLIFVPPLEEQKRIAAILDQADELRRKRQRALDRLYQLGQAIFVEMFGVNHEWPTTTVGDILNADKGGIRTGPFGSQLLHSEFVDRGIAVLGIDNAVKNEFSWSQRRFITEEKFRSLKRFLVHPGDLIVTIMGTCGRCAIIPDDIPVAINTKHLCCISLNLDRCIPEYLHSYFLGHPIALEYLRSKSKGAIMHGLNMGVIKSMPVILPPIWMQHEYRTRRLNLNKQIATATAALNKANSLFDSLQHNAFRGQLSASTAIEIAA